MRFAATATALAAAIASSVSVDATSKALDAVALPLKRIAFGSCNHQAREQPLWPMVLANEPQLWIWMGDVIYGDYKAFNELKTYLPPFPVFRDAPPEMLREKYALQLNSPGYAALRQQVPVIGVWDDHDYGRNDGDKTYKYKVQSQQIFLDFVDEPSDSPRRNQEGVYTSYLVGSGARTVKFVLLDVRYHKDPYGTQDGDFLGAVQWEWLTQELAASSAAFNVIVSGVQILPQDRFYRVENWNRFPAQRERLLDLVLTSNVKGAILLSGDVHFAEINQVQCDDYTTILTEITSSGMTHSWDKPSATDHLMAFVFRAANIILPWDFRPHRLAYYGMKNFGEMEFDWDASPLPLAKVRVRGEDGEVKLEHSISSHYAEHHTTSANPASTCRAIHESSLPAIAVRRLAMVGFVGCLLGVMFCLVMGSIWLVYVVFKRSYLAMMNWQHRLFDQRGHRYQKVD